MEYYERTPLERIPSEDVLPDSPAHESLPALLQIISSGNYSGIESASLDAVNSHSIEISNPESGVDSEFPGFADNSSKAASDVSTQNKTNSSNPTTGEKPSSATDGLRSFHVMKSAIGKGSDFPHAPRGGLASPRGLYTELIRKVSFASKSHEEPWNTRVADGGSLHAGAHRSPYNRNAEDHSPKSCKRKYFSQPMPAASAMNAKKGTTYSGPVRRCSTVDPLEAARQKNRDEAKKANYVIFRTKSLKPDKPLSRKQSLESLRPGDETTNEGSGSSSNSAVDEHKAVPAGRYFDALKGPELDDVKDSEELLLPVEQQWPFLLRFTIGCFGICLGLGSQAVLYKTLAISPSTQFLHIPLAVNFVLWCLALAALIVVSIIYGLKCLLYFEAVRREYYHPVRVNFFFAPWIACMFLTIGIPPRIAKTIHPAIWCVFAAPLLMLKLKIYGQWLSGGQRRLSKVANPTTHLSLVGNFVSALLGASVGWKEAAIFFWAVGCAHYLVVFVTLYQRLPTAEVVPKELHPVFFLFVAAPSVASVAWKSIAGSFDRVSRIAYFLGLFLYASLVVRIKFFSGFQFSITWWAYTFPMTASAIATINYSVQVPHPITKVMAVVLSIISTIVVGSVFVTTVVTAIRGRLFPNDVAIAISAKRHKRRHKGSKVDPVVERNSKRDEDDSTKLFLPSEGGTIVASLENGLISVKSDPYPAAVYGNDRKTS
ncbi:hypothetical protein KP509_07G056000 [Ceratopteris richardii]|uniref:SLOW ANION CHANNEL-ASSOCIATED 1b n=2 Tax=Ceratopteris richardii TaxID=49495 RepID=A0A1D6ZNJ0_CERRI|nr:SLOW ANION CHANNEL-ASSOCIATED 1b [Ceratopteris richardii]KAH7433138.1 hypothetical protein KP509_07G056000 [Ceratopteris richardii]